MSKEVLPRDLLFREHERTLGDLTYVVKGLTYDDILVVPAHSSVLPADVNLESRIARGITLQVPIISAAMDKVTEYRLALAMAE